RRRRGHVAAGRRPRRPGAHHAPARQGPGDRAAGSLRDRRGGHRLRPAAPAARRRRHMARARPAGARGPHPRLGGRDRDGGPLARRERWMLPVRFAGSAALVSAEEAALRAASGGRFTALRADEAHALWMRAAESFATRPVTFRVGGLPDSSDELMDLLQHQVGDEWISASPGIGAIRWGGETTVDRLRRLRRTLAGLEVPLTLERAPWPVRAAVGHFG